MDELSTLKVSTPAEGYWGCRNCNEIPSVENTKLLQSLSLEPGVGQNTVLHALYTDSAGSSICLTSTTVLINPGILPF